MQALGTGPSGTGHSAVAVWRNDTLFVAESTHNLKFYGNGIMATQWSEWWAKNAANGGRMVALLVLEDVYRTVFNEEAFWSWFDSVKGTPYGFNNYLFSGTSCDGAPRAACNKSLSFFGHPRSPRHGRPLCVLSPPYRQQRTDNSAQRPGRRAAKRNGCVGGVSPSDAWRSSTYSIYVAFQGRCCRSRPMTCLSSP